MKDTLSLMAILFTGLLGILYLNDTFNVSGVAKRKQSV